MRKKGQLIKKWPTQILAKKHRSKSNHKKIRNNEEIENSY